MLAMQSKLSCWAIAVLFLLSAGCRSRESVGGGESTVRLAAGDAAADDVLWNAVQDSIRDYRFRIDRVDSRAGVVTSLPETSKQLMEFWRNDAVTLYDMWESTINPIRRWIEVRVEKQPDQTERLVAVTVHKERLSSPDRQFNNSTAAYRYFGESLPSTTGITRLTPEYDRWLSMGRDPALESRLVDRIIFRSNASVLERSETHQPAPLPATMPVESQPEAPGEQPTAPPDSTTTMEVWTSQPAVTPPPAQATSPTPTPPTQPMQVPPTDDGAAIVPMRDVEGSTPVEPVKEADDSTARP